MKSHYHDRVRYDATYTAGKDFGAITCPRCDCKVLYGTDAPTRPKYCPDCESRLKETYLASEYWDKVDKAERESMVMQELRMPMPAQHKKTVQEVFNA